MTNSAKGPTRDAVRRRQFVVLGRIGVAVGFLLFWQLTSWAALIDPLIARSPSEVFGAFLALMREGVLLPNLASTLHATAVAWGMASVVGILAGVMLGTLPRVEVLVDPFLDALNSMPRIAFAPVFILFFGINQAAKIALAFTLVVFILVMNTRAGVKSADLDILRMATVLNMSRYQLLVKVLIPGAVPAIFAGLRLGLIYSLLGVVASEMLAARAGLGQLIAAHSATFNLEAVYAVVIALAVTSALLNGLMVRAERYLLRWQRP